MTDDVRNIVLGVVAAGISATLGWFGRTCLVPDGEAADPAHGATRAAAVPLI
ncbi:hypothetical protein EV562_111228 [Streptomyces sp. BK208]|uniref:hypothetical protein n=1 Tax=Streptomyces sp. BK208 TaxID=2512150 RepID=UPI0010CF45CA|nr:hypothetical protein [Streptomyces sp. BK208]TDT31621.1 hypothetical protein EV562_111228 [Streptomyces sp. BK208]